MSDSEKTSVPRMILQAVEDFATIVKGEVEIAKKSLTTSVKKLGLGIGFVITAFLLLNVSLLFLLIRNWCVLHCLLSGLVQETCLLSQTLEQRPRSSL